MALNDYKVLGQVSSGTYVYLPVDSVSVTSNIATITTGVEHNMGAGDGFEIAGTNQAALNVRGAAAAIPTTTSFNFPVTTGNVAATTQTAGYVYVYLNGDGQVIINKEKTNGMVTLTTVIGHNMEAGDWVTVDIDDTNFDGTYMIYDTPTTTTFRYVKLGADVTTAAISVSTAGASVQKATELYAVPATKQAVCSTLTVANNLAHSAYFSIYAVKSGDSKVSPPDKSIIANQVPVESGESYSMTMGHTLAAGDSIVVRASHAGMYFNLFGSELS
jgi:hypothetical protein